MSPSRPHSGPDPDVALTVPPTPPLLALLQSPQLRKRTRAALGFGTVSWVIGPVTYANDWSELGLLAEQYPGSPALVDTLPTPNGDSPDDEPGEAENGRLCLTPLICYARPDPRQELRLSRNGINIEAHLSPGVDDRLGAISEAILGSIDVQCVHRLRARIDQAAHPEAAEILGHALDLSTGPCSVAEIARRVDRTPRTLQRRCTILGTPSPKRLLSLAQIYTVQRLAEWSGQPYGGVAVALGHSHRSNYRRLAHGVFGQSPTEIEQCGGHEYVAETILRKVS